MMVAGIKPSPPRPPLIVAPPRRFDRNCCRPRPAAEWRRRRRKEGTSREERIAVLHRYGSSTSVQLQQVTENYPPLPPSCSPTFTQNTSWTTFTQKERERDRELHSMLTKSQGASVCALTPKHRFNSDDARSACTAIFKITGWPSYNKTARNTFIVSFLK